ncbi:MAG: protein-tyrosine-phosphatase [Pirellula sp.]
MSTIFMAVLCVFPSTAIPDPTVPSNMLSQYVRARTAEFDKISNERKTDLDRLADYVTQRVQSKKRVQLIFICTHNSRRSHISQIWASVAAAEYGVEGVETFSGGTEATAFNPRAIAAMHRAGLEIKRLSEDANPKYQVRFSERREPLLCFSKKYDDESNPQTDFCAVMTCSQADQGCPLVRGADLRIALPFDDPKAADGTPGETARYDERCLQIAREMLYVFSRVQR